MNIEAFREFCLSMPATTEDLPFDEYTLAFKVGGKIFALTSLDRPEFAVNLKCNPDYAIELRDEFPDDIKGGYHMNKKHWNTVQFEGNLTDNLLKKLTLHSYQLVVQSLKKAEREPILADLGEWQRLANVEVVSDDRC